MSLRRWFLLMRFKYKEIAFVISIIFIILTVKQILDIDGIASFKEEEQNGAFHVKAAFDQDSCNALEIRHRICKYYFKRKIGGNMCAELCKKSTIKLEPVCLAKKQTTVVMFGKWKNQDIVLKTKDISHSYKKLRTELINGDKEIIDYNINPVKYRQAFASLIKLHVLQELNSQHLTGQISSYDMLERLYHPSNATNITYAEMKSLWQLSQQEEYIKLKLLQDNSHFPQIYGYCGKYYIMERVSSLRDLTDILRHPLPWNDRAKIALEFLDLITEFKNTLIGTLSHCDIQRGNFGVANDNRLVALDVDTVFTQSQMDLYMTQDNCSADTDCSFFDCISTCRKGFCTNKMVTNNLHVVCRDIFDSSWTQIGLLSGLSTMKKNSLNQLKQYLIECAGRKTLPWTLAYENELQKNIMIYLIKSLE